MRYAPIALLLAGCASTQNTADAPDRSDIKTEYRISKAYELPIPLAQMRASDAPNVIYSWMPSRPGEVENCYLEGTFKDRNGTGPSYRALVLDKSCDNHMDQMATGNGTFDRDELSVEFTRLVDMVLEHNSRLFYVEGKKAVWRNEITKGETPWKALP